MSRNQKMNGPRQQIEEIDESLPPFVAALWSLVNSSDGCSWTADGSSIIIADPDYFEAHTLPTYFKHSQLSSFIRQLNMYNFSKTEGQLQWTHPKFRRNHAHWLPLIKRKPSSSMKAASALHSAQSSVASTAASNSAVSTVRVRLSAITESSQAAQPAPSSAPSQPSSSRLVQQQQRIDALLAEREADQTRIQALEHNEERMRERLRKSRAMRLRLQSEVQQLTRMLSSMLPPTQYCELKDLFAARDVDELDEDFPSKSEWKQDDVEPRKQKKHISDNVEFQLPSSSFQSSSPRYDDFIADFPTTQETWSAQPSATPSAALIPSTATFASLFTPMAGDLRFDSESSSRSPSSASSPAHQRRRLNNQDFVSSAVQSAPIVISAPALMAQFSDSEHSVSMHGSSSISPTATDSSLPPLDSWTNLVAEPTFPDVNVAASDASGGVSQSQYQWLQMQLANFMFQSSVLPSTSQGASSNDISKA